MKKITTSEKETFEFAKSFAKKLKGGEVIGLVGELGAGKTIFTKGLAAGLGIKRNITSPTFVLMRVYEVKKQKINTFVHIDAYRIKSQKDIIAIGAEEYFNRADTITVIEWVDRIYPVKSSNADAKQFNGVKKILPKKIRFVNIINKKNNKRLIFFR